MAGVEDHGAAQHVVQREVLHHRHQQLLCGGGGGGGGACGSALGAARPPAQGRHPEQSAASWDQNLEVNQQKEHLSKTALSGCETGGNIM